MNTILRVMRGFTCIPMCYYLYYRVFIACFVVREGMDSIGGENRHSNELQIKLIGILAQNHTINLRGGWIIVYEFQ